MKPKLPKVGDLIQIDDMSTVISIMFHYSNASKRYADVFEKLCKETNGVFQILNITSGSILIAPKGRPTSQIILPHFGHFYTLIK